MMQVVQILVIFLFFLFIFLIGVSRHFRVKIIISWLYTTMAPIFAAARESYLPESFRKVDDNNPFFSLSPPMLRVSEASLDIGLYSNNNLCNYVYVWVHALASLVSFLPSYACRANVSLSLSLSLSFAIVAPSSHHQRRRRELSLSIASTQSTIIDQHRQHNNNIYTSISCRHLLAAVRLLLVVRLEINP
jgi:hypothetical protein